MNLDLDPAQGKLVDALRNTKPTGSASAAVKAAGVVPYGALEWCLVFEELGSCVAELDLPHEDLLSRAAYAVGVGRRCLELAQKRAGDRVIGGRPLIEFQGPAHRLANASTDLAGARVGLWRIAWSCERGIPVAEHTHAAAALCVTAAVDCAHELVQIFGAAGSSDPVVVRLYQAAYDIPALCGSPGQLWQGTGR